MPDFLSSVMLKYLKLGYQLLVNHYVALVLVPILVILFSKVVKFSPREIVAIWNSLRFDLVQIYWSLCLVIFISTLYNISKPQKIYLVDFACYKAPAELCFSIRTYVERMKFLSGSENQSLDFQLRISERIGLGERTCMPPAIHLNPPNPTMKALREEAEMVIFSAMDSLFQNSGLNPRDIDVLVVNCSICFSTPSLSAMVINKYKMNASIKSFNILGMGCSGSLISIDLVRQLLHAHPSYNAVVVSAELMTTIFYRGKERSMLVPNSLFRMGGAALFLSTKNSFRNIRAKYRLLHLVRTHTADDDKSYNCVYVKEDPEGILGIWLSKDLMAVAGEALKLNLTALGPLVLPVSERFLYLLNFIARRKFSLRWKPYIPDFKQAFKHFCIHAGGPAVIDGVQDSLQLSMEQMEASRSAFHRFGNTSSSSLWYEMSYIEAKGRMIKGDRVLQIAFGSGYKCFSAVWECTETVRIPASGPWIDCIDNYPTCIPRVVK
ncbi:3-ketoacyl-CoA synthase [Heracleum sosnowskyi]|uniref:3-ketoacyl-CoA synthase n=1 Tax=Heracleum sosnowskyi TaxID=360622 RepID=A0AAD8HWJ4_9APIA|nr:3-ketoacyl-CoA synthase [Heracleum sosnowskyi]